MSFNPAAALKTGLVIAAIWGLMIGERYVSTGSHGLGWIASSSEDSGSNEDSGLKLKFGGAYPVIEKVEAGSLADISGLKSGDTLKAINRATVHTEKDVNEWFSQDPKGLKLNVLRDGKPLKNVILGEAPAAEKPVKPAYSVTPELGANVQDMVGMYPAGVRAPMTLAARPGSLVEKAGIKAGEWILAINGQKIATAAEYRKMTEGEGPLTFTVLNTDVTPRKEREVKVR